MKRSPALTAATALSLGFLFANAAEAIPTPTFQGPSAYASSADSPYDTSPLNFCLENFEDSKFDIPGATITGGPVGPGGLTDSVDGDDGAIDGSGTNGRSWFNQNGAAGITIEFDPTRTNGLPTQVGIVWTDGAFGAPITFDAYDENGVSILGPNGPNSHADNSNFGTTAEDRFYGITSYGGVAKINISNTSGGIEIDHVQLNNCALCGDANHDIRLTAPDALIALKTSVGTDTCNKCVCDTNASNLVTATDALAILRKSVGLSPVMNCPACVIF